MRWAEALLCNGLGRYADAFVAAQQSAELRQPLDSAGVWGLVELVDPAARSGQSACAASAVKALAESTQTAGSDWALGVEARSRALANADAEAEPRYLEAIERLGRTRMRGDLARAHLVFGDWLRRARRRRDAQQHLLTAHQMFSEMGADAFAARAVRELHASGATVHKSVAATGHNLTPQEEQIARLFAEGLSNPEVAGRLFLAPAPWNTTCHKVFTKLRVTSRHQLPGALSRRTQMSAR